jgi:sterol desaturase/sphingolipid hydroxylase (fatty acid hydroxylase superfamily)
MNHWLETDSTSWRLLLWLSTFLLMALLERVLPRRDEPMRRTLRWPANLGLVIVSSGVAALLPFTALIAAYWAQQQHWGLLNQLALPAAVSVILGWLLLDAAIYWQHRLMHLVPALWRLHRVHHSDTAFDTSTALRFHPVEIVLSVAYKGVIIIALGAPPLAVFIFEVLLSCVALFNHANLRLRGDAWLRYLLVTPDLHRIHHSVLRVETDSNYGNVLSLWDWLFRSYTPQPRDGQTTMRIGLAEFRDEPQQKLPALLTQPLQNLRL